MKKIYILITFLSVVSLTLQAAVIYLSNQTAGDSLEVSQMKGEMAILLEENRHLRKEVLKHASIKNIASRAAEIGFGEENEFISLEVSDSIASR